MASAGQRKSTNSYSILDATNSVCDQKEVEKEPEMGRKLYGFGSFPTVPALPSRATPLPCEPGDLGLTNLLNRLWVQGKRGNHQGGDPGVWLGRQQLLPLAATAVTSAAAIHGRGGYRTLPVTPTSQVILQKKNNPSILHPHLALPFDRATRRATRTTLTTATARRARTPTRNSSRSCARSRGRSCRSTRPSTSRPRRRWPRGRSPLRRARRRPT